MENNGRRLRSDIELEFGCLGKKDVTNSYNSEEKKRTGLKLTNFIIEVTNDVWCNSLLITRKMIVS